MMATQVPLDAAAYAQVQRFIHAAAGITLADGKQAFVSGRLSRRLASCGAADWSAYLRLLASGTAPDEVQTAIDLLTTNETYFFREPRHFDLLRADALRARGGGRPYRMWSAASSSGEEVYSAAMVLDDCLGRQEWELVGSDISARMLERARAGHYPLERARLVPPAYLKRYCRKGQGAQEGTLLVARELRERVRFGQVNLNAALPSLGSFDVVFLRNVMIYFSAETRRAVVERVAGSLRPGGLLVVGHTESLLSLPPGLQPVVPSVYRKRAE